MVSRLIVPLDQSLVSESALPLARGLAVGLDAEVTLVAVPGLPRGFHDGEPPAAPGQAAPSSGGPTSGTPADMPHTLSAQECTAPGGEPSAKDVDQLADKTAEQEEYLHRIAKTFSDTQVESIIRPGDPAQRILETAGQREGAVIVMASHGRSGLQRAVVGSVTASVIHAAECPVFVVRGAETPVADTKTTSVSTILAPLDGSDFSEQVLTTVRDLFGFGNVRVFLLRVVDDAPDEAATQHLEQLDRRVNPEGGNVTWAVGKENVPNEINQVAGEIDVDLIAMATHGRSGVKRLVIGSVAEQVLHEATRPLLLVRPAQGDQKEG